MYQTKDLAKQKLLDAGARAMRRLAPPPRLTVSQWADVHRRLSSKTSAEPGRYDTSRTPYAREIMDCWTDHRVKRVVMMSSAQVGKTTVLENIVGYHIHHDPGPIMIVRPTLEMAETLSKDHIAPMISDSPALSSRVAPEGSRKSGNTLLKKAFPGGQLVITGANSPASLRSRPIRILLFDEVDAYQPTVEGDPVELAEKRTAAFRNAKIGFFSTPASTGSKIQALYEESDRRMPFTPCPKCSAMQVFQWENTHWTDGTAGTREDGTPVRRATDAWFECQACGHRIREAERLAAIERIEWRAQGEFHGTAGFWLWQGLSPFRPLLDTVNEWLAAYGRQGSEQVFINTALGRVYNVRGEAPDWEKLKARAEDFPLEVVPAGGLMLTAGVDVQQDRLEVQVRAWGRNKENWLVHYERIDGAPSRSVFEKLEALRTRSWRHASGAELRIEAMGVDTGFATQEVYNYCRNRSDVLALDPRASGSSMLGLPTQVDINYAGKRVNRGARIWPVNVSMAKHLLYGWMRCELPEDGPLPEGYCHHPRMPEEFWRQLCSEQFTTRINSKTRWPKSEWVKIRERNEALDTFVYALAAAEHLGLSRMTDDKWTAREIFVGRPISQPAQPAAKPQPQPAAVGGGSFWSRDQRSSGGGSFWSKR